MEDAQGTGMYDVFISYAREDRKRIRRLVDLLVGERGWSIWFDEALRAGDEFPRVIQQALEQVRCVLVVWSNHAIGSRWVIAEASEGWERGILVPLRLDDAEPPLPFRQTEATDFSDWNGSAGAAPVLKLIEAIDRALQRGSRPEESELLAREERRRAYRRRKLVRRTIAGTAAAALVIVGGFGWQQLEHRAAAERLAERAAQLQAEIRVLDEEERKRTWGSVLLGSPQRLDRLEVATLLAVEAVRRARTDRTQEVLDGLLAMSPWSDRQLEVEQPVVSLKFNADGTWLVADGEQKETLVWNLSSNAVTRIPRNGSTSDIDDLATRVATTGPGGAAAVWDAQSGQEMLRLPHDSSVTALAFVPHTDTLATVSENGSVRVWDLTSGQELRRMEQGGTASWISASDSGHYLTSTTGQTARVWDAATGAELARLEHAGPVDAARFSVDETLLVTFGDDIETTVWELPGGSIRKHIPVSAGERAGALFGPDGRTLVIGSTDGDLRWWSLDEDEERYSVSVGVYVLELASSANHERFVTAGNPDYVASTWEFASGQELRQMPYPMWLRAVAISADGRLMASSGFDGNSFLLEITEVRPDDPLEAACRKVHRNLTRNEWREYIGAGDVYRPTCPQIAELDTDAE